MAEQRGGADKPLEGQVALVAGATRGAGRGIARALGEAGALVYCTGRSAVGHPEGMDRSETIDETVALIEAGGGRAFAARVDHAREEEVANLADSVRTEAGRLDVLVNSIWGATPWSTGRSASESSTLQKSTPISTRRSSVT